METINKTIRDAIKGELRQSIIWYLMDWKFRESKDVSKFLAKQVESSPKCKAVVDAKKWKSMDDDFKIIEILDFVYKNVLYTSDLAQYKRTEYWAAADETLMNGQGDCEDMTILIYTLARLSGINEEKLWVACGDVLVSGQIVGHCWLRYESDNFPVASYYIDACYYPDISYITNKKKFYIDIQRAASENYTGDIFHPDGRYRQMWFMCNEKTGYRWRN